jgi:antibiotic biosynthesis monooxygenase (ABM) superfamily enzyme
MEDNSNTNSKPKLWKMLIIAWIYAYILVNAIFALLGPYIIDLNPFIRGAIITTLLVPAMGLGIPAVQKKFFRWTIK